MRIACHVGAVKIVKECFPDYIHIGAVAVGLGLVCECTEYRHRRAHEGPQDSQAHHQFHHGVAIAVIDVVFGFHFIQVFHPESKKAPG